MKKLFTTLFLFAFLMVSVIGVSALESPMRSVDVIVSEIRTNLGITVNDAIDVNLVDQVLLEELGDSVMEAYIGDSEQHEALDEYYGGDDSETLTELHTQIGSDYLNGYPITMMTFMQYGYSNDQSNYYGPMMRGYQNDGYNTTRNYGMMGRNNNYYDNNNNQPNTGYGMMRRNYNTNGNLEYAAPVNSGYRSNGMMNFGSGGMFMGFLGFVIVIGAVVYLVSNNSNNRNQVQPSSNNALNIVKERYARGEITREEFLQITSTLK